MSQSEGATSAEATLSSWDGRFVVESSKHALRCSPFSKRSRLNATNYNGYAATEQHNQNMVTDDDDDSADGGKAKQRNCNYDDIASISSADGRTRGRRRHYFNSPTRGGISGQGSVEITRKPSSRLGSSSRQLTMGSSLLGDSMTEVVIEDLQNEHEPTSAILDYCKRKFLKPFMVILSLVGLSPISTETTLCRACLSYMLDVLFLVLLFFGYLLQYSTSYRGDRGFSNYRKVLPFSNFSIGYAANSREGTVRTIGELLFGYIIPNTLHFVGFIAAVFVCRVVDNEQLQNLIERVFLACMKPRRLCIMLWIYVMIGFTFLIMLFAYVMPSVLMQTQIIQVKWLTEIFSNWQITIKTLLLVAIFLQDFVEIVILTSYCIECYLLRVHLITLSHKLLMHSIDSLDWMREVLEFRKLLDHLNERVALPVCFFIVMNLSYAFAAIVYLFNDFDFQYSALKVVILNIINVFLWLIMGLMPFFMAASVTRVCQKAQATGHQIRVRPFVYHNTSTDDLNSTLLFASSLDMSAKLFRMPIQPNYLCFAILVVSIVILTLGMCLNLSVLGAV